MADESSLSSSSSDIAAAAVVDDEAREEAPEKQEQQQKQDEQKKQDDDDDAVEDVFGNGQLLIRRLSNETEGQLAEKSERRHRPTRGELVSVRFTARRARDGHVVARSPEVSPFFEFILGDNDVVQAWDFAVALMSVGEKALITTAPRFAYDKYGNKELDIGPDETMEYEVEVVASSRLRIEEIPVAKRAEFAARKKERGNELYAQNEIALAKACYQRAFDFCRKPLLPVTDDEDVAFSDEVVEDERLRDLAVKCLANLSFMQLKLGNENDALEVCNKGLALEPKNVKLLYRKGQILSTLNEFQEAIEALKTASELAANSTDIRELLVATKRRASKAQERERQVYRNMMRGADYGGEDGSSSSKLPSRRGKTALVSSGLSWMRRLLGSTALRLGIVLSLLVVLIGIGVSVSSVRDLLPVAM